MQEHFTLKNSIYLVADGVELDLHNDYNFVGLDYSIEKRVLILRWVRNPGEWVAHDSPAEVELEYREVQRFEFRPRDLEMPFTEDDCLSDAGYCCDAGWPTSVSNGCEATGVFSTDAASEDGWLRAFQFQSGSVIVVLADQANAKIKNR